MESIWCSLAKGLPESQSKGAEDGHVECSQYSTGEEPLLDTLVPGLLQLLSIPTNKVHVRWTVVHVDYITICPYVMKLKFMHYHDSESLFSTVVRHSGRKFRR